MENISMIGAKCAFCNKLLEPYSDGSDLRGCKSCLSDAIYCENEMYGKHTIMIDGYEALVFGTDFVYTNQFDKDHFHFLKHPSEDEWTDRQMHIFKIPEGGICAKNVEIIENRYKIWKTFQ